MLFIRHKGTTVKLLGKKVGLYYIGVSDEF